LGAKRHDVTWSNGAARGLPINQCRGGTYARLPEISVEWYGKGTASRGYVASQIGMKFAVGDERRRALIPPLLPLRRNRCLPVNQTGLVSAGLRLMAQSMI